jgi:hypothetical protein
LSRRELTLALMRATKSHFLFAFLASAVFACGGQPPQGGGGAGGGGNPGGTGGTGGQPTGPTPTNLPSARQTCPNFTNGDMSFLGRRVRIFMNASTAGGGPVIFYWHGTLSNPNVEAPAGLGPALNNVVNAGGIVAGFYSEPSLACPGCPAGSIEGLGTGNSVWFKKDFETADEVLACAIEKRRVDTRRLWTAGMSAGGLQASAMIYERSNYLAAGVSYSGGKVFPMTIQDPNNKLPFVLTHGGTGDTILVNFKTTSEAMANELKPAGHFIVMCDHGRGHTIPNEFSSGGWTWNFFSSHPYKVTPEPYQGGLPGGFPSYCRTW